MRAFAKGYVNVRGNIADCCAVVLGVIRVYTGCRADNTADVGSTGNFTVVFKELFGGGEAKLTLTDPDNVLESGIEITVQPPGKIINNLASLSGGEQTFVAIAIYFAILCLRPAPFCILDEIEAALDEVNVERLAQYIKRYSHGTQFIMITHRRGTMAAATRLYGVTMPEQGVTKLLALHINEVEEHIKEKIQ